MTSVYLTSLLPLFQRFTAAALCFSLSFYGCNGSLLMLGEYKIFCLVVFCALLMILEIQQNVKDVHERF